MTVRSCEIVQQIKYLPGYPDYWREELEKSLEGHENIKYWAYIVHDKDVDDNGQLKAPHIHAVIILTQPLAFSTIASYVGVKAQHVSVIKQRIKRGKRWFSDEGGALSYLTHRNAPEKQQYDDTEVVAKPGYDWQSVRKSSEEEQAKYKAFQRALQGIESGEIRRFNLNQHVSMDMYIDHKAEFDRAFDYREAKLKMDASRKIDVVYITGDAGSGKTTLAKKYCEDNGLSYCLSGSSRDPLQEYNGQDALILDDLRPSVMPLSDLLKMLDNHSASAVSARYHDRWLEVSLIIITTVLSIEDFFFYLGDPSEPIQQLKRRCRKLIRLTKTTMDIYSYRSTSQEYMLIGSGANPITAMYAEKEDDSDEDLQAFCGAFGVQYQPEGLPSDYLT